MFWTQDSRRLNVTALDMLDMPNVPMFVRASRATSAIIAVVGSAFLAVSSANAQQGITRLAVPAPQPGTAWIGLTTKNVDSSEDREAAKYSIIVSVEPQSPANKAGLAAGDTIVNLREANGHTVALSAIRTLKPGRHVTARIRRNGARDLPLTLEARPSEVVIQGKIELNIGELFTGLGVNGPGSVTFSTDANGTGVFSLVGAQVVSIDGDLADVLHVEPEGLFVTGVVPQTPAATSGLRGGDVIVSVDGTRLTSFGTGLQLILEKTARNGASDGVSLDVKRKGKSRKITLHF